MGNKFDNLMNREMSRKEFMAILGMGIASIFGFANIIRLLTASSSKAHNQSSFRDQGFGAGDYGNKSSNK